MEILHLAYYAFYFMTLILSIMLLVVYQRQYESS